LRERPRDRCYDFKIFSSKNSAKKFAFFTQNKAKLCKIYHNIGVLEKRHFFAKNCQKSQKIVIITSTPACQVLPVFVNRVLFLEPAAVAVAEDLESGSPTLVEAARNWADEVEAEVEPLAGNTTQQTTDEP
jgi:hypothetical protein